VVNALFVPFGVSKLACLRYTSEGTYVRFRWLGGYGCEPILQRSQC
jgi:hypothetical protein